MTSKRNLKASTAGPEDDGSGDELPALEAEVAADDEGGVDGRHDLTAPVLCPQLLVNAVKDGVIDAGLFPKLDHVRLKDGENHLSRLGYLATRTEAAMVYVRRLKCDIEGTGCQEGLVHLVSTLATSLNEEYPGDFDKMAIVGNKRKSARDDLWEMYSVRNKANRLFGPVYVAKASLDTARRALQDIIEIVGELETQVVYAQQ